VRSIIRFLLAAALGVVAAGAVALPATAGPAAAKAVLTVDSLGGAPVAVGDALSSGLKAGTLATFGPSIKCTASTLTVSVTSNPAAGGVANSSLTTMTFGGCSTTLTGITCVQSITGNPSSSISINGTTKVVTWSAPTLTMRLCTTLGMVTCTYSLPSVSGTWSNTDNSISLSATFSRLTGPAQCPTSLPMAVTWAPIRDVTVSGSPLVFAQ
jgi:hypothetical protein